MKMLRTTTQIGALALSAILILACSGISSISQLAGGAPATNTPATSAPAATTSVSVTPTRAPTAPSGTGSDAQVIATAVAKTKTVTMYRVAIKISGIGALVQLVPSLPANQEIVLVGAENEVNGKDSHDKTTGLPAMLFVGDPTKTLETIQVGGKTFVRGPIPLMDAPADKWYVLDPNSGVTLSSKPLDLLDKFIAANSDWSRFAKTRSGETLDGQKCNVYGANKDAVADSFTALTKDSLPATIVDGGSTEIAICDDGYLHTLTVSVQAHDTTSADRKGKLDVSLHLFDVNGNITITAPADAVATGNSRTGAPTSVPVATKPALTPSNPNVSTGMDGYWEGTTSNDAPVSFTVKDNQVTGASLNLFARNGGCSGSTSLSSSVENGTISNNSFAAQMKSSSGVQINFSGTFSSGQFTGTLQATGKLPCDVPAIKETWSAQNTSVTSAPTKPVATKPAPTAPLPVATKSAPTGGTTASDPKSVIDAFFNAVNTKNQDAALALVSDNPIFDIGPTSSMGKENLRVNLIALNVRGITFTLSNYDVVGNTIVDFTAKTSDGATYKNSSAIISNGKISILTVK